jgi:hypothetical protein
MNKRETWFLIILLIFVAGIVYLLENQSSSTSASNQLTPTMAPIWTLTAETVQAVRFEDLQTGLFVDFKNDAGKWAVVNYALVTPSLTPTSTSTAAPSPTALAAGVTPTSTPTATNTATSTITATPTATLAISLTPTLVPTMEAEMNEWGFVVNALVSIVPEQNLGDALTAKDFGLDKPTYRLTIIMTDGKKSILNIGSSAPVKSAGYYAQISGSKTIYLLPANLMELLIGYLSTPPTIKTATPNGTATPEPTQAFTPTLTPTAANTSTPTP